MCVCVGGRYRERMGEEGRVKCRGEREDRPSVRE